MSVASFLFDMPFTLIEIELSLKNVNRVSNISAFEMIADGVCHRAISFNYAGIYVIRCYLRKVR